MLQLHIKPGDRLIRAYYESLGQFGGLNVAHEGAVSSAFQSLLAGYSKKLEWTVVPQYRLRSARSEIIVDAALLDFWKQRRGFWEAKDQHDNLERQAHTKIDHGYPTSNIIFQAPERAILYQGGCRQPFDEDITDAKNLAALLAQFFAYREPDHEEWDEAVAEFSKQLPEIAERAKHLIDKERRTNREFIKRFDAFYALCRETINPNLSFDAVEGMLIQHLLTERIFRRVFHAEEFRSRNVIAAEIEKVISSLTAHHFSRDAFLSDLDRFYRAIERAAGDKDDYSEKQAFLNGVYERFFQGYSPKEADTHGIVYTPQPIVDFMVRSVEDILQKEFGRSLAGHGVHILDPFVGTGNFIVRVMRQIAETRKSALPYKYENELHCNEIMLLPYYIASMNIEHEYLEHTGDYKPFPGICLVDTFELAEAGQSSLSFMTEENTARVKRQKEAPIFVIIGNPPYNAGQANENDNNKNRKYGVIDRRVAETYGKGSLATNKNALGDPYVKAIRWASDRLGDSGVIAFVSNSSFFSGVAFDGMRKSLGEDFASIVHVNLKGDARTSGERRRREGGNVFEDAIRVGVGVTFFVRNRASSLPIRIDVHEAPDHAGTEEKQRLLSDAKSALDLTLTEAWISGDGRHWATSAPGEGGEYIPIAGKETKAARHDEEQLAGVVFGNYGRGVATCRDAWVYSFSQECVKNQVVSALETYNAELSRWVRGGCPGVDGFVTNDLKRISWSEGLKLQLKRRTQLAFHPGHVRTALYRPFDIRYLYFDSGLVERRYQMPVIFPLPATEGENRLIVVSDIAYRSPYSCLAANRIVDLHLCSSDAFQSFPFYVYDEDGTNRRENITDWALAEFRKHYHDPAITKWDIFHYVYAVLHHPEYRQRYAANLKRELPRIPYAPDFRGFAEAGARLADLHVSYEKQPEYPLRRIENPKERIDHRVEKMRLSKDKRLLVYNRFLTLDGIPPETYQYRLGNRSALEWVVDQYQASTDKRSGIKNDPNRADDPEYIVRLVGQVIHLSLKTVEVVKSLPSLGLPAERAAALLT
jgi:predicted helicase